jgi:hypothetical protein
VDHVDRAWRVSAQPQVVDASAPNLRLYLHRSFAIFCYFMLLRIRGNADELSPRLILHVGLAFALAPLLLAKVLVVRYQKTWGALMALGISIFVMSFTLVTLNVSVHYLRNASPHKIPFVISLMVVAVAITLALVAFLARSNQTKPKSDTATVSPKG